MATKPSTVPRWAETAGGTPSAEIDEPTSGDKDIGWEPDDRPPAEWFNWILWVIYLWVIYLRDGVIVGEAGAPGLTVTGGTGAGGKGMVVTAGGTNEQGIAVASTGSAAAVAAVASGAGAGVDGTNTGAGPAFSAAASGGTGYALFCVPNTTKAPIFLGTMASDPSSLDDGAMWYNSTAHKFRGRANGVTVDFH